MCGIFGVIFHGKEHAESQEDLVWLFSSLAVEAAVRGTDATGLARVDTDGYMVTYRNVVPSYDIVKYRRWWRPLGNVGPKTLALLGHTRFGTHGANTIENAHPFPIEGSKSTLVGTHNGVLWQHEHFGPKPAYDSDSRNLFHGMAQLHRSDWPELLGEVQGSFALAWADQTAVYLARNTGNPCVVMYLPQYNVTAYASTEEILKGALKDSGVTPGTPNQLPAGVIWRFSPGDRIPDSQHFPLAQPSVYGGTYQGQWTYPTKPKVISASDSEDVMICGVCGKETSTMQCQYVHTLREYVCRGCATDTGRCDWCSDTTEVLYIPSIESVLCQRCTGYAGVDHTADGPRCEGCNRKGPVVQSERLNGGYCEVCLEDLNSCV